MNLQHGSTVLTITPQNRTFSADLAVNANSLKIDDTTSLADFQFLTISRLLRVKIISLKVTGQQCEFSPHVKKIKRAVSTAVRLQNRHKVADYFKWNIFRSNEKRANRKNVSNLKHASYLNVLFISRRLVSDWSFIEAVVRLFSVISMSMIFTPGSAFYPLPPFSVILC